MPKKQTKKSSLDQGYEDDGVYDGYSPSPEPEQYGATPKSTRKSAAGRSLKRWAPGEDQLLLLYVDQVCVANNIALPWDAVAVAMEPRLGDASGPMTGEAVKQHLAKLRSQRENQGQRIPPKVDRATRRRVAAQNNQYCGMMTPGGQRVNGMPGSAPMAKKPSTILAPLTKKEQANKDKMNREAARAAKAEEAKAKAARMPKTPAKQRKGKVVKAGEDSMITPSTLDHSTGQKRGRVGGYGEPGLGYGASTPLPKRLRPSYEVNYAEPSNLPDEEDNDLEYKDEPESVKESPVQASMGMRGRGAGGMHSGADAMTYPSKQAVNQYDGGNFRAYSDAPKNNLAATTGMGAPAYTAPTADMATGHGMNHINLVNSMNFSGGNDWFVQPDNMDEYGNVYQPDNSFHNLNYGFNHDQSAGSSTQNSFSGLPASSPVPGYGDFGAHGQYGAYTGHGGLPVTFNEPLALPSTENLQPVGKQSFDSGVGSSLAQTPVNDAGMDGGIDWNYYGGCGEEFLFGIQDFANTFNDVDGEGEKYGEAAQNGGFASFT